MPIIQLNQTRSNDTYLIIDFALIRYKFRILFKQILIGLYQIVAQIIHALNILTNNHARIGLIMALGLGFGFGLTIFSQPDLSSANFIQFKNGSTRHASTQADYIETNQFVVEVETKTGNLDILQDNHAVTIPSFSGELGSQHAATYFKGTVQLYNYLNTLELGDEIRLNQRNNLIKTYQIVEIRLVDRDRITQLLPQNQPTIILYTPTSLISNDYYCLIARN